MGAIMLNSKFYLITHSFGEVLMIRSDHDGWPVPSSYSSYRKCLTKEHNEPLQFVDEQRKNVLLLLPRQLQQRPPIELQVMIGSIRRRRQ